MRYGQNDYQFGPNEIRGIQKYLPFLEYKEGVLHVAGKSILDYRSCAPVLIYIEDRARENLKVLTEAFQSCWPHTSTFISLKSCYIPPLIHALVSEGAGLEVMSDIELQIASQCGAQPSKIISSGIGRGEQYLRSVASIRPRLVLIDNLSDLRNLTRTSQSSPAPVSIGLRATPVASSDRYVTTGSKAGADVEAGHFDKLLRAALVSDANVMALHAHVLGRCRDPRQFADATRDIAEIAIRAKKSYGVEFEVIDIGGGLDTRSAVQMAGHEISEFATAAALELARVGYEFELIVEPGRFIFGDACVGIANVVATKHNAGIDIVVMDIASNILIPRPAMIYPVIPVSIGSPESLWQRYAIGDQTGMPTPVTAEAWLPEEGKLEFLAVLNCGAYTTVFAEFWAVPLPTIMYVSQGMARVLFGHENQRAIWKELYDLDIEPRN